MQTNFGGCGLFTTAVVCLFVVFCATRCRSNPLQRPYYSPYKVKKLIPAPSHNLLPSTTTSFIPLSPSPPSPLVHSMFITFIYCSINLLSFPSIFFLCFFYFCCFIHAPPLMLDLLLSSLSILSCISLHPWLHMIREITAISLSLLYLTMVRCA